MADEDLTRDGFLGGRVLAWQPRRGFRAGADSVLMPAAVPVRPGQSVLELGTGPGVAALCLLARVPGASVTGVEVQPAYATLARRNAAEAGVPLEVVEADLTRLPAPLRQTGFDHVMANPPYFDRRRTVAGSDPGRERAFGGETPLAHWIDTAARRLATGGTLTLIQRTERLAELIAGCDGRFGSLEILPLAGRTGRVADRVILRARKGGRAPLRLLAPFVLHAGAHHQGDGEDLTPAARAVLRDAAALPFAD